MGKNTTFLASFVATFCSYIFRNLIMFTLLILRRCFAEKKNNKIALYLCVYVFSTKVLIGTAILRGHWSLSKVQPLVVQREYLHFSVILRP